MAQTDEEVAEMIARFRTPPGFNWEPLRNDIVTLLRARREYERELYANAMLLANPPWQ